MKHTLEDHAAGCPRQEDGRRCPICDGGLALCTTCHGAEGDLPTECPGTSITDDQRAAIVLGVLDFVGGRWINPKLKELHT